MELANIACMIYDKTNSNGKVYLVPRKSKVIGSAIGIERVTSLTQGKQRITQIDEIARLGRALDAPEASIDYLDETVDCIRTLVFLITDGGEPGHGGRSYIVKKFIRRFLTLIELLGIPYEKTYNAVSYVLAEYESFYPNLSRQETKIMRVVGVEKTRFEKNLRNAIGALRKSLNESELADVLQNGNVKYGIDTELLRRYLTNECNSANKTEHKRFPCSSRSGS